MALKILIAEDETLTALWLEYSLGSIGYQILKPVSNGSEAVKVAAAEKPDALLMDIQLADNVSGIDAAGQILSISPGYCPKIIFMTGYPLSELKQKLEYINYKALLNKPVQIETLQRLIDN